MMQIGHELAVPPNDRDRPEEDDEGRWHLPGGQVLSNVHRETTDCRVSGCSIHNPSKHHMRKWPMNFRDDTGVMERICPHGVGHPDPDALAYLERKGISGHDVHGCDGCCVKPYVCPRCQGEMFLDGEDYICGTCRDELSAGSPGR